MIPHSIKIVLFLFLFITTSSLAYRTHQKQPCPRSCSCPTPTTLPSPTGQHDWPLVVNCTGRGLSLVPEDLPIWTEVLLLAGNPLETLSLAPGRQLIMTPNNLTTVDFSATSLRGSLKTTFLSALFNDVAYIEGSLVSAVFDRNQLTSLPLFTSASGLRSLSVVDNRLEGEALAQIDLAAYFPLLETLDLSDNTGIGSIPRHFLASGVSTSTPHHHLHTLLLHNTRIEVIEAGAFDRLPGLQVLKLSRNGLTAIGNHWLGGLPALRELDLNSNRIQTIGPLAFNGSKSLEVLKMRRNRLDHLADGAFWGLSRLRKLYLDHNNLTDVRLGWTYGLLALSELTLRHNSIREIAPGAWTPTPALSELTLSHNQLTTVDGETFAKLPALKTLKLNANRITVLLEAAFSSLTALETLDLAENQISVALESASSGLFSKLAGLRRLHLEGNQIRLLQKGTFSGLAGLEVLNLSNNPISSIQNGSFAVFTENLQELGLAETDLVCDCTLKWLLEWLRSSEHRKTSFAPSLRCKHPNELYRKTAKNFLDAKGDDFHCRHFLKPHLLDDYQSMLDRPLSAIKGKNMTFYCKVATSATDKVTFQWIKDGHVLSDTSAASTAPNNGRTKVETLASSYSANATLYTNVLTVLNVADEDAGAYQCVAANAYDSVYSHKFTVAVHVVPFFARKPASEITVRVGGTARLECAARGQPAPVVSWRKLEADDGNGKESFPAAEERRMRFIPSDDVYFIVDVTKADAGRYSCNATNDAGTALTFLQLNVIEPPSFVRRTTGEKEAKEGGTVSLECMAAGLPQPKVTWYREGVLLEPTQRHFFTAEGQLLIIVKLRGAEDAGKYSCKIDNDYGSAEGSFRLVVGEGGGASLSKFRSPPASSGEDEAEGDGNAIHALSPSSKTSSASKSLSHQKYSLSSMDFGAASLLSFLRTHLIIMLIIVLCVVLTSIIWIVIICYLRRGDAPGGVAGNGKGPQQGYPTKKKPESGDTDLEDGHHFDGTSHLHHHHQQLQYENDDEPSIAVQLRGGSVKKPLLLHPQPYTDLLEYRHHNHHQSLGYESESSSARDTGIEGSCQSSIEDQEDGGRGSREHFAPFSYTPSAYREVIHNQHSSYRSLPRQSANNNQLLRPLVDGRPMTYQSLPRRQKRHQQTAGAILSSDEEEHYLDRLDQLDQLEAVQESGTFSMGSHQLQYPQQAAPPLPQPQPPPRYLHSHSHPQSNHPYHHHYHQPNVVATVLSGKERKKALKREKDLQISTCKQIGSVLNTSSLPPVPSSPLKTFSPV